MAAPRFLEKYEKEGFIGWVASRIANRRLRCRLEGTSWPVGIAAQPTPEAQDPDRATRDMAKRNNRGRTRRTMYLTIFQEKSERWEAHFQQNESLPRPAA